MPLQLLLRRLSPRATPLKYHSPLAVGLDLAACLPEDAPPLVLAPGDIAKVPTGWAIQLPHDHEGQVRPRSGLAAGFGVTVVNSPGTIDPDYRGEVIVPLVNLGRAPVTITHAMRIAQLVIAPIARPTLVEVDELGATERGEKGFGSTGR
ncbi:dUTP diphosphatase [soil metagenome]